MASRRPPSGARDQRHAFTMRTIVGIVVLMIVAGVGYAATSSRSSGASSLGPENMPLEKGAMLASADSGASGQAVDGITCDSSEHVAYHIHAHLAVYVEGTLRPVPAGIGVVEPRLTSTSRGPFVQASRCYYWLHTHVQDGVLHVESPTSKVYTLGNFFDVWNQPLDAGHVASAVGTVTAYVNGKLYAGDPRGIPLSPHAVIQLDLGSASPAPQKLDWSTASL